MNNIPVIVIAYNRPWHTAQVLDALKRHNIQNLYIFSDAPKAGHDAKSVSDTRNILKEIKWTTPEVIYQKDNIGLAKSILNAANYVFEKHNKLILLEDDCVPQQYFFDFIYECLSRYEDNKKIFGISGYALPIPEAVLASYPYDNCFFPRICSWGWATWKRAWDFHENDLRILFDKALKKEVDLNQGGSDIPFLLDLMLKGDLKDVWTLAWQLTVFLHGGGYVHPTRTHIVNIGMDGSGLHCGATDKFISPAALTKPTKFTNEIFYDAGIVNNFRSFYDRTVADQPAKKYGPMIYKLKSLVSNLVAKLLK